MDAPVVKRMGQMDPSPTILRGGVTLPAAASDGPTDTPLATEVGRVCHMDVQKYHMIFIVATDSIDSAGWGTTVVVLIGY